MSSLNPSQQQAVDHVSGPLLILAGAGSGKTKTAIHRIEKLLIDGVPPEEILVVTFTNKAAGEIKHRLATIIGPRAGKVTAGTFHSIAARMMRMHPGIIGLRRDFLIHDDDDSKALFKACARGKVTDDGDAKEHLKNAYGLMMGARERDLTVPVWARKCKRHETPEFAVADAVWLPYMRKLLESNAVDFPGLLIGMRDVVKARDDLRRRYTHIIVDEYQDTNVIQDEIVTLLGAQHRNVTVVGDDAQAIYEFRGANVRNILDFPARWPGCTVVKLEQNYRSRPEIIDLANRIIGDGAAHGKVLKATRPAGGNVTAYVAENEYEEAERIAKKCLDLHTRRAIAYNGQAVLYRTNVQSRVLEHAMNAVGVPYRIVGGLSFWERAEIRDCIAYMRLMRNRDDDLAFRRVINVPRRGIGDAAIKAMEAAARGEDTGTNPRPGPDAPQIMHWIWAEVEKEQGRDPLRPVAAVPPPSDGAPVMLDGPPPDVPHDFDDLEATAPATPKHSLWGVSERCGLKGVTLDRIRVFKRLVDETARVHAIPGAPDEYNLTAALSALLAGAEYARHLAADKETQDERWGNVQQLLDLLDGRTNLAEFLEEASLLQEQAKDSTGDRVTLCTIHAAKGLEWEVVYLPGWEAPIIPSPRGNPDEERRLAYVAITRARDMLFIGRAKYRRGSPADPSLFLIQAGFTGGAP